MSRLLADEVKQALRSLPKKKATGIHNVAAEIFHSSEKDSTRVIIAGIHWIKKPWSSRRKSTVFY